MEKKIIELSSDTYGLSSHKISCYVYEVLASTNIKAWELCREKTDMPFVVVAKQQTAGKGQRGNYWDSGLGGLYLTVVLSSEVTFANIRDLTLFSAVGITEELNKNNIPVKIKWLNDLILDNKKLGGILSEVRSQNGVINNSIIGVGINWENKLSLDSGISLCTYLKNTNGDYINSYYSLLNTIVKGIFNGYRIYKNQGINSLVKKYNQYLIYRGKNVVYENIQGRVKGIDVNGNLEIRFSAMGASSKVSLSPDDYAITLYDGNQFSKILERK
ncbi:biotin--[acetyl-CoA-carboxylase] ligase [Cyanobacterium stanieri LEGE 03274]|uniref:Biotin--[acetyl-CoA-carboxylase] ligase n=1 Tax=Cyanobacterium stanieri LEGE 03274 TaxID=1828756 RepID=A0ABR9V438_9CHRO|nr:biotin--[acetyl-CoA-carboxylase] ligase [Cyanobacterium stanieri]MBE9222301.1 biotin--[acetyl-CoA-carboxylase] ligase [Cyanobacterium stanieri LEGE 03274]